MPIAWSAARVASTSSIRSPHASRLARAERPSPRCAPLLRVRSGGPSGLTNCTRAAGTTSRSVFGPKSGAVPLRLHHKSGDGRFGALTPRCEDLTSSYALFYAVHPPCFGCAARPFGVRAVMRPGRDFSRPSRCECSRRRCGRSWSFGHRPGHAPGVPFPNEDAPDGPTDPHGMPLPVTPPMIVPPPAGGEDSDQAPEAFDGTPALDDPAASESDPDEQAGKTSAQRLTDLFAALKKAATHQEAAPIAARIQWQWSRSGSATVDLLMPGAAESMAKKDNGAAMDVLDQTIVLDPAYAEAWNRRATLNFTMGRWGKSLADIEQTLSREPRHWGAMMGPLHDPGADRPQGKGVADLHAGAERLSCTGFRAEGGRPARRRIDGSANLIARDRLFR